MMRPIPRLKSMASSRLALAPGVVPLSLPGPPPSPFLESARADPPFSGSSQVNDNAMGVDVPPRAMPALAAFAGNVYVASSQTIGGSPDIRLSRSPDGGLT